MQNVFKIIPFLPHNWLDTPGLRWLFIALFYATLFVGVYAAFHWLATFWADPATLALNSAPLRRIYGLATLQALLACTGWSLLIQLLGVLGKTLAQCPRQK